MWKMNNARVRSSSRMAAVAILTAGSLQSPPAAAGNNLGNVVGGVVGGIIGGLIGSGMRPQRYGSPVYSHHSPSGGGPNSKSSPSQEDSSDALASLAPPSSADQVDVLKGVTPVNVMGSVGTTDDLERMSKMDQEENRDYIAKIEALLSRVNRIDDGKSAGDKEPIRSDITEHAILESLDNAIRATALVTFEKFRDESWSPERLRVMILDRVTADLGDALDSSKHQALTMHDFDTAILKAARSVQARLFETSELLAANRDSTLFLLRLYQTHGDVSSDVREHTERVLLHAVSEGMAAFEGIFQRDPNGYALRYRGERIIYDCLTENVEAISASDTGVAPEAEIEQRLLDIDKQQCVKWVADQLVGKDGAVKPQEPVPLRVVWSAHGPIEDDSMLTRAPDEL